MYAIRVASFVRSGGNVTSSNNLTAIIVVIMGVSLEWVWLCYVGVVWQW